MSVRLAPGAGRAPGAFNESNSECSRAFHMQSVELSARCPCALTPQFDPLACIPLPFLCALRILHRSQRYDTELADAHRRQGEHESDEALSGPSTPRDQAVPVSAPDSGKMRKTIFRV